MGARGSLTDMFRRSLGASSFARFWHYWNPVFGYYLGTFIFTPVRAVTPRWMAVVVTFVVCGALHDAVTAVARGGMAFLFTPWFFFLSIGVLVSGALRMDLSHLPWRGRAAANVAYAASALALALFVKRAVPI